MIARPFALVGFSFVSGLLALNLVSGSAAVLAAVSLGCIVLTLLIKKLPERETYIICALSVIAACVSFEGKERFEYKPALSLVAEDAQISAVITDIETNSNGTYYTLKSVCLGDTEAEYNLRLKQTEPVDVRVGDSVSFCGDIKINGQNEMTRNYYKSKGIYLLCTADGEITVTKAERKTSAYYMSCVKEYVYFTLLKFVGGDSGGVAVSMLTGDKGTLQPRIVNAFKVCGLSHTLAVSGLHMNIIVLALYKLLNLISKRTKRVSALLCIPVAVFYAALSGFSVSAVRACVMICVMLLGKLISRKGDSLNSLGLAALIITLVNPYAAVDWSFMLSFSSTLGIILFLPYLNLVEKALKARIKQRYILRVVVSVADAAIISLVANLFTLPVMILFVGTFSLVFLAANLAVFWAVPLLMVSAAVTVILNLLPFAFPAKVAAWFCSIVSRYMLKTVDTLSKPALASVRVDSTVMKLWLAAMLVVIGLTVFLVADKKRAYKFGVAFICVSLAVTGCAHGVANYGLVTVTALDVGDEACFIVSYGTAAILVGCSDSGYVISNALEELGVTNIELAVVPENTRRNCIKDLQSNFAFGKTVGGRQQTESFVYDFYGSKLTYVAEYDYCVLETKAGNVLFLFGYDTPQFDAGKADFLFTLAQPPEWINTADCKAVIVSAGGNTAVNSDNVYSTYDNSNLTLNFNRWGKYKINSF